jgi:mono/diheme cytochrome c family protein
MTLGSHLARVGFGRVAARVLIAVGALVTVSLIGTRGAVRAADGTAAPPTFAADVAPILYANCVTCHRPGQAAPFSLLTYDDALRHGKTMANVTGRRYMPPWHAARAEGFPDFRDERHLSDEDIATIKAWVDAGMPSGDLTKAAAPPVFPPGWSLGTPDVVLDLPVAIDVPAEGPDEYQNVVLSLDQPEDRWITALDFEPSARKVVHHALFYTAPASVIVGRDEVVPGLVQGLRGGGARGAAADQAWSGLGGWVPGMTPRFFPDGIAQPLPRHTNIVMQLHLHPSGKPEHEQGRLAVYFAKTPPEKSLTGVQVPPLFGFAMGIDIPAGESHYVVKDSFTLPVDVEAYGARGHAHYLCREMKLTATLPDGTTRGLLWIKDWDFGWQDSYYYKTPFTLPKGTEIHAELTYDNSDANPRNPSAPPKRVTWGRGSFDEMGSLSLLVAQPPGAEGDTLRAAQAVHLRQQLLTRGR